MTAETVELHSTSGEHMLSTYWESVLLTRRADGTFTLKVHAGGDGTSRTVYRSRPFQSARGFLRALDEAAGHSEAQSFGESDLSSWLDTIDTLSPPLALALKTCLADSVP